MRKAASAADALRGALTQMPLRFIVLFALLWAPAAGTQIVSARQPAGGIATVLGTDALTMRACPDVTCEMMEMLPIGTTVAITGEAVNGFAPVEWNGRQGWASQVYLFSADGEYHVRSGVAGCNRVALIFNAGIGEAPSEAILATLQETGTPATLFAMGWWADAYPDYLRRMAAAGAAIGSHGHTQALLTQEGDAQIIAQVQESAWAIERALGAPPERLFTPYATDTDARVGRIITEQGWLPIRWSVSAGDYGLADTPEVIYDRVMTGVHDGAIIELHLDGAATDQTTAVALPWIIGDLRAAGYTLVTVPELLLPCGAAA